MTSPLLGRRVLVVEDELMVSWVLEDMLADLGCKVIGPAARVEQALAIIESESIDMAVLDLNLNGVYSCPVATALQGRGIPFVLSTGYNKENVPDQTLPFLQKPYEQSALRAVLMRLMRGRDNVLTSG